MALETPPIAPQRGDRTTFSLRTDAFLSWLVRFVPQLSTLVAQLTTLSSGGANSFSYLFDPAIADADPGAARLRLNTSTQNAATVMRFGIVPGNGGTVSAFLTAMQAGTSNIKGSVRLQKFSDPGAYLIFDITNVRLSGNYVNLDIVPRASSSAAPLAVGDSMAVYFDVKGDRGDGGNTPTAQQMRDAIGTLPVANGGTGATTAITALANLGGVPLSNPMFTTNVGFNNNTGFFFKDSAGNYRSVLVYSTDDNIYATLGPGGLWNMRNAAMTTTIWSVDNNGTTTQTGASVVDLGATGQAAMTLRNTGSIGAQLGLFGNGGSSPNKAIRAYNGAFEILGNAGNVLATILEGGTLSINAVSAGSVTEVSDERKKKNWRALTDAQLDALADLEKVGVFDWVDGSGAAVGGSAQAIRAIVPEAVHEDADGNLSVAYGGLAFAMAQGALRRAKGAR